MKRIRTLGLCLLAAAALAAVTAGGAYAAPEFHTCVKAAEKNSEGTYNDGEYSKPTCANSTAKVHGRYKLGPFSDAKKDSFRVAAGKSSHYGWLPFEFNGKGEEIGGGFPGSTLSATECSSTKGKGTYTASGLTLRLEVKGCRLTAARDCATTGAHTGVTVYEFLGTLVDLPDGRVGLDLEPTPGSGGIDSEYNCDGIEFKEIGGTIGETEGSTFEADADASVNLTANANGGVQSQWNYPSTSVSEAEGAELAYQWTRETYEGRSAVTPEPDDLTQVVLGESEGDIPARLGTKWELKGEALKIVG